MGKDLTFVQHEFVQELELDRGEQDINTIPLDAPALRLDHKIPDDQGLPGSEQPTADKAEATTGRQRVTQDTKPDRRSFEERNVEELRDRARELEIEGRASMSKDELIAALREQRQPKQPNGDADKAGARAQDSKIDRRPFAERSLEELRDRARELEIEGRSAMSKDELIAALRQHAK